MLLRLPLTVTSNIFTKLKEVLFFGDNTSHSGKTQNVVFSAKYISLFSRPVVKTQIQGWTLIKLSDTSIFDDIPSSPSVHEAAGPCPYGLTDISTDPPGVPTSHHAAAQRWSRRVMLDQQLPAEL